MEIIEELKRRLHDDFVDKDFGQMVDFPASFGTPKVLPPEGKHPRVYVTEELLPQIRENMDAEENREMLERVNEYANKKFDGIMPTPTIHTYNYSGDTIGYIECMAFRYLVYKEEEMGYRAILAAKNYLLTAVFTDELPDVRYYAGSAMYLLSEVYDWCYDLMTEEDKEQIICGIITYLAPYFEIGVPPMGQGAVTGHGTGGQILKNYIAFAIATYDEHPEIYMNTVGRFYKEYIDAPNFYYPSGINFQGSAYGLGKTIFNIISEILITRMSGQRLYDFSFEPVIYGFLSYIRPDGEALRIGDDYNQHCAHYGLNCYRDLAFYGMTLYDNPVFKTWYMTTWGGPHGINYSGEICLSPVSYLLLNKPWIKPGYKYDLPCYNYQGGSTGAYVARSRWDDENAWMTYNKVGEAYAANHEHKDAGQFQIYYKGILAMSQICYEYNGEYYGSNLDYTFNKQTISKNCLLIYDPEEECEERWLNSGGQRIDKVSNEECLTMEIWRSKSTFTQAKVLSHGVVRNDEGGVEIAYLTGDITNAYDPIKAKKVIRTTVTAATGREDYPMAFFVYDRVESVKASQKKTFLLHVPSEPEIREGNVIVTTNTWNNNHENHGMLVCQPLTDVKLTAIGGPGHRFEVNGVNQAKEYVTNRAYEIGWGRVEMSPVEEQTEDVFMTAFYVGDASMKDAPVERAKKILKPGATGISLFGIEVWFPDNPMDDPIVDIQK